MNRSGHSIESADRLLEDGFSMLSADRLLEGGSGTLSADRHQTGLKNIQQLGLGSLGVCALRVVLCSGPSCFVFRSQGLGPRV